MVDYVEMRCDLTQCEVDNTAFPADLTIDSVSAVAADDLYRCYHAAFAAGDAWFFFTQSAQERRNFFDALGLEQAAGEPASVVLLHDAQVIGFSLVLPIGPPANRHISCMCIDPDWQGRGLGKQLLWLIMARIKTAGGRTITLGTEPTMRAFRFYQTNGFKIIS